MLTPRRTRDERGVAFPSPIVVVTIVAIALAAIAFVVTGGQRDDASDGSMETVSEASSSAAPSASGPTASATPSPSSAPSESAEPAAPEVDRAGVFVEVYNNSGIPGLAGTVADRARSAGWNVVGVDNWHGNIPESTVYYPDRLKAEAKTLAGDLGIARTYPAVEPMRFDRLTLILTSQP